MSLKGTETAYAKAALAKEREAWDDLINKFGGAENVPWYHTFEEYLCFKMENLKNQFSMQVQDAKRYREQRNLALILCAVFLALALFLAFRPREEAAPAQAAVSQSVSTTETFSEWTARQQNYVASASSDKYHRLTCYYADNILAENRIYFATENEAKEAGKSACSACRP